MTRLAMNRCLFATLVAVAASIALIRPSLAEAPASERTIQPYLLQMIRDDSVHEELRLSTEQVDNVLKAIGEVDPRWWVSRIMPAEKQQAEIRELTEMLSNRLSDILDPDQNKRLLQLQRQARGTRMILQDDVRKALKITDVQADKLQAMFANTDTEVAEIRKQLKAKEIEQSDANRDVQKLQQRERTGLLGQLTKQQQAGIGALVGKTFDFAGVKRTYPLAPEFVVEGAEWIQGEPVKISDLRGKVVAVYFYAFQCINCQRNFPHYKSWHADLAQEGLVVIGIQTPETSAERNLERVKSAASSDGFEFPVLFDEQSGNWRAWGNTMWPTTYLIDKDGFIRRWWQGEMNWQGTPGEQQMRDTIKQLLAED